MPIYAVRLTSLQSNDLAIDFSPQEQGQYSKIIQLKDKSATDLSSRCGFLQTILCGGMSIVISFPYNLCMLAMSALSATSTYGSTKEMIESRDEPVPTVRVMSDDIPVNSSDIVGAFPDSLRSVFTNLGSTETINIGRQQYIKKVFQTYCLDLSDRFANAMRDKPLRIYMLPCCDPINSYFFNQTPVGKRTGEITSTMNVPKEYHFVRNSDFRESRRHALTLYIVSDTPLDNIFTSSAALALSQVTKTGNKCFDNLPQAIDHWVSQPQQASTRNMLRAV